MVGGFVVPTDTKPLSISWSRLKTWEDCKQRVLLNQQGKASGAVDGRIFLPGTIADRAMRQWLNLDDPQPGQMPDMIDALFDEHTAPDAEYVIKWRGNQNQDRLKVKNFVLEVVTKLEPILLEKVIPYRWEPEIKFRYPVAIPYLDGTSVRIDLIGGIDIGVQEDDDEYAIYDLKATANDAYVRGATLGQLIFYDLAWRAGFGKSPKAAAFITPACRERFVPLTITDEDRRVMMSRIIKYAQGVWAQDWKPKAEHTGCNWCEVKHACPKWALPNVRDDQNRRRVSFADAAQRRTLAIGGESGRTDDAERSERAAEGDRPEEGSG